jgi:hypothetical protein
MKNLVFYRQYIIQPIELHIHGLAPSIITSEVILHLTKNSKDVTFSQFFSVAKLNIINSQKLYLQI